jgi:hypothetical protein
MPLAGTTVVLLQDIRTNSNDTARRVLSITLNALIRHAPGPVYVSRAAQDEARRWGLRDLREYSWYDQIKVMGDTGRKMFAWDHFYPVAELRRRLDSLKSPTVRQARRILKLASIAWILKDEDRRLNALGFRHKRPDPVAAYATAGIRLLHGP